jgi:GTPase
LNALTAAKSKVGNYQFTTLEPSLGAYYELVIADIPGLIEGASEGRGLGIKFLRHVERTDTLFHLISCESDDVLRDYDIIRRELERYSGSLKGKREYVFLTKTDAVPPKTVSDAQEAFQTRGIATLPISVYEDASLLPVRTLLNDIAKRKHA